MPIYGPPGGGGSGDDFSAVELNEIPYKVSASTFDGRDYNSYQYQQEDVPTIGALVITGQTPVFAAATNADIDPAKSYRIHFYCNMESDQLARYGAFQIIVEGILVSTGTFYAPISGIETNVNFSTVYSTTTPAINGSFEIYGYCERSNQSISLTDMVVTVEEL